MELSGSTTATLSPDFTRPVEAGFRPRRNWWYSRMRGRWGAADGWGVGGGRGDTCTLHPSDRASQPARWLEASEACGVSASVRNVSCCCCCWCDVIFVGKVFGNVRVLSGDAVGAAVTRHRSSMLNSPPGGDTTRPYRRNPPEFKDARDYNIEYNLWQSINQRLKRTFNLMNHFPDKN